MSVLSPPPDDQLLEPTQVAALMGVDLHAVARWARSGRLDAVESADSRERYKQADVLGLMVQINRTRRETAARSPGAPSVGALPRDHAAVAEASLDVSVVHDAVLTAQVLAAQAAVRSQDGRMVAARAAQQLVADVAAQNAVATRFRADAAATRVSKAAQAAAALEERTVAPGDQFSRDRAARTAATVEGAAAALAKETAALATMVAKAVAATAALVEATGRTLDRAIAAEVAAAAAAVELRAVATARVTADDVAVRIHGSSHH